VLPFSILFFTLLTVFLAHIKGPGEQGGSSFIPYVLLLLLLFPSIKRIMRIPAVWRSGKSGLEKINSMLVLPLEEDVLQDYEPGEGKIEFKNVSFSYDDNYKVLDDASFTWQPGPINYIDSKGKTTLFKLLIGLYVPTGGEIFIDGNEISKYSKKSLRDHIAFLSEGTGLHGKTIYKCLNIRKGIPSYDDIQDCLRLLRFSMSGKNKEVDLHKYIGPAGRLLSHSDCQKLKIARTLLSKKKILIIDGIIESLDEEAQRAVIFSLEQIKNERTIIISGKPKALIQKKSELAREWSLSNSLDSGL
jgi:ABC-type multidrug transport system fused ATPase/permease subunit